MRGFILGAVTVLVIIFVGGYLFITNGGVRMETTAKPLPLEETVAGMALRASIANAGDTKDPLPMNDETLLAGAQVYQDHCAVCHGNPGGRTSAISKEMFPPPPQLFGEEGITDDPEGVTYWVVTHGIRLSGMPGFQSTLSDAQRWQVTLLDAHANKLPPAVLKTLSR